MFKDIIAPRTLVIICAVLAVMTFAGVILSQSAMNIIMEGEADGNIQWLMIQTSAFVTFIFVAAVFWLLAQIWILIGRAKERLPQS
jgi:hypothetical protein